MSNYGLKSTKQPTDTLLLYLRGHYLNNVVHIVVIIIKKREIRCEYLDKRSLH